MSSFPKLHPSRVKIDTLGDLKAEGLGLWFECFGPRPRCPTEVLDLDRLIQHFGAEWPRIRLRRKCPRCGTRDTKINVLWNAGKKARAGALKHGV